MKCLKFKPVNFLLIALLTAGFLVAFPTVTMGAMVDLIPPEITVIAPVQNAVAETGRPWIEVQFGDSGAGIEEKTIALALDQVDVTGQAQIENPDLTSETGHAPTSANRLYRIRYQPMAPLTPGEHEVYFCVRDLAGNLAEQRWRFQVSAAPENGFVFSGANILQWDQYPLTRMNDVLDLAAQGKVADTDVRLQLSADGAGYPGAPLNYQLERYSLSLQHQSSNLLLGYGVTPLQSELFQGGMELLGGIFTQRNDFTGGALCWDVFSGETAGTYGLGIDIEKIWGVTCGWESSDRWKVETMYAQLGGGAGYDVVGLRGNTVLKNGFLIQYEWLTQNSKSDGSSENGVALHLNQSFQTFEIGLDYLRSQPDHPPTTPSASLIPGQDGMQRIGVRTRATLNPEHTISFNISSAEDNLDQSNLITVKQRNVAFDYLFVPDSGFNLDLTYLGGFQDTQGSSTISGQKSDQSLTLVMKKSFHSASTLQASLSLKESQLPSPQTSFNQTEFWGVWSCPLGNSPSSEVSPPSGTTNLTPSLRLTRKNESDGSVHDTAEARVTLDFQTISSLPRNKVSVFWNTNTAWEPTDNNLTCLGLDVTASLGLWKNSILTGACNFTHWVRGDSEGWDPTLSMTWKVSF